MHVEATAGFWKDLEETREGLGNNTRNCDALREMVRKLEERLATMCDAPRVVEENIEELESRVALNARDMAYLATHVKDHRSSSHGVAAKNGELSRKENDMNRITLGAVSSAEQLQAMVSTMAEKRDFFGSEV